MTDEREARIRAALRELERAEEDVQRQREAFWRTLAAAHDEGLSFTAIGRLLGVTRQRAAQLVEQGRT